MNWDGPPLATIVGMIVALGLTAGVLLRGRRADWPVIALLGGAAFVFALAFDGFLPDDSYITYRYAHNLLTGRGFVYNPGEHVLSTTTPLYALILALFGTVW